MSREAFKSEKVSILALVLPTRCGGVSCLSSMPNLKVTGRTSLLLKLLPGGVQTLNDLQFITNLSREMPFQPLFSQHLFIVSLILLVFYFFSHLFNTLTSFMTSVNLLSTDSRCLCQSAAGWSNESCMWSVELLDFFHSPSRLSS